jgi:gliding motility-associated-like protein
MKNPLLISTLVLCQSITYSQVTVTSYVTYCEGKAVEIYAEGDSSFAWVNINEPDSILSTSDHFIDYPETKPTYLLYTSTDTILIETHYTTSPCFCHFYIPNAFTPTGDVFNDKFYPVINCNHKAVRMTIYSREQLVVFDEQDIDVRWDGTNPETGIPMEHGMYAYLISFLTENDEIIRAEGFVMLMR